MAKEIEIEGVSAYRCAECESLSEETSGEKLYECPECGSKAKGEDGRRCEDCKKARKKIATDSCAECDGGEVEGVFAIRCNADGCGELLDPEAGDLHEHLRSCFEEVLKQKVSQKDFDEAERVQAIICPYCGDLVTGTEEDFAEHLGDCSSFESSSEMDPYIDEAISEAEKGLEKPKGSLPEKKEG